LDNLISEPKASFPEWLEVRISAFRDSRGVIDALFAHGSQGVQEVGAEIVTYFPISVSRDEIRSAIAAADSSADVVMTNVEQGDWSEWRARVGVNCVGALTVAPPWLAGDLDPATTVVIDPAMAFGTGEHATTRGVIRLMQTIAVAGASVADLGAGSAVLSIAAAKLGAARVVAIEVDADAGGNAMENIRTNGVADRVHYLEGDAASLLPLVAPVDIVLANILSSVLLGLLPLIHDSLVPAGHAILSGILFEERPTILDALARNGWQLAAEDIEEEWWSVLVSRR
jgi:ribosomal protein L11 methyltransferase